MRTLQRFDLFPKTSQEVRRARKGRLETCITFLVLLFMALIFIGELYNFLEIQIETSTSLAQPDVKSSLLLNLDLLLHNLKCEQFDFDLIDDTGYLYMRVIEDNAIMYPRINTLQKSDGERGCRVWGKIEISRISGELHMFGRKNFKRGLDKKVLSRNQDHTHSFDEAEIKSFDGAHEIVQLFFEDVHDPNNGTNLPKEYFERYNLHPLNGKVEKTPIRNGLRILHKYVYFIKVMSMTYEDYYGKKSMAYQHVYTIQRTPVNFDVLVSQPGVFLRFSFSPFQIAYKETGISWKRFVTTCCAILGGMYVVFGKLHQLLFYITSNLKLKST